jgi:predicted negative regulator of RcsB-dependent stress response
MKAWAAERRRDLARAHSEREEAVAYAGRVGLDHFYAFALTQLGSVAMRAGDLARAEKHLVEALSAADACAAGWFAALARARLAEARALQGDADGARSLAGEVLGRDDRGRRAPMRGFIFEMIGGDPVTLARAQLG